MCTKPSLTNNAEKTTTKPDSSVCRDFSSTCEAAKQLCDKGFMKDTFRQWCKKTCGICTDGGAATTPVVLTVTTPALPPTKQPLSEFRRLIIFGWVFNSFPFTSFCCNPFPIVYQYRILRQVFYQQNFYFTPRIAHSLSCSLFLSIKAI